MNLSCPRPFLSTSGHRAWLLGAATLLAILYYALTVQPVYASWESPKPLATDLDDTTSVALGDLDGDGDLDVVIGNQSEPSKVYLNDGTGVFQKLVNPPFPDGVAAVAVGDLNGDGALDILFGRANQAHQIFLNDGAAHFGTPITLTNTATTTSVAIGDVTGDSHGWLDIVAGNYDSSAMLYTNLGIKNGSVAFDGGQPLYSPSKTKGIALGNLLGDPTPELVLGNQGEPSVVLQKDGSGHFSFLTALQQTDPPTLTVYTQTNTVALGDVDGDGRLDIILAGGAQPGPSNSDAPDCASGGSVLSKLNGQVYQNRGGGAFAGVFNFTTNQAAINSIALGDVNNNGVLDMVAGVAAKDRTADRFFLNLHRDANPLKPALFCQKGFLSDLDYSNANALALGDLNGDGFLDLVIGNAKKENVVYLHDGRFTFNTEGDTGSAFTGFQAFTPTVANSVSAVVLGDMDADAKLDVVALVGNTLAVNQNATYSRTDERIRLTEKLTFTIPGEVKGIAVGDLDGDTRLDLVAAGAALTPVLNQTQGFALNFTAGTPLPTISNAGFKSVVLGDINHDTYLDVLAGGTASTLTIALNDGKGNFTDTIRYSFPVSPNISSMALGDLNGDGALDLVVGHQAISSTLYFNDGTGRFRRGPNLPNSSGVTSLAIGDVNNDGALDIVAAIPSKYNLVYFNDGVGRFANYTSLASTNHVTSLALGDLNGDGALDIVAGQNSSSIAGPQPQDSLVYFNDGKGQFAPGEALFFKGYSTAFATAIGDLNGDGVPEIIQGTERPRILIPLFGGGNSSQGVLEIYQTSPDIIDRANILPNNPHRLMLVRPGTTSNANFYATPEILSGGKITVTYKLFDRESDPVGRVELLYSLDGGGKWYTAAATNTITNHLATAPFPTVNSANTHTFIWDIYKSGFFGQSDNVVLRLKAYPQEQTRQPPGTYLYTDTIAGPYQWPYASAMTFPFRVRGTQVRVFNDAAKPSPVAQALVYRLPEKQATAAFLLQNARGPLVTDAQGYLQGRELLAQGDRLIALAPITHSVHYTLYSTSQVYDPANLNVFAPEIVQNLGVQALIVSAAHPLLLFNLTVSLEWDASDDEHFREDLKMDLAHVSQTLYDWTNGQAALGNITIYANKQHWQEADIRIYATNRLRPYAKVGGITRGLRAVTGGKQPLLFARGQVHIGPTWNRYGEAGADQRSDWINTLAHELGHYLFFLLDNYTGLDAAAQPIEIQGCPGVMSNPYDESVSEFHPTPNWLAECGQTLAQMYQGRSDWATITAFYPALSAPSTLIDDPAQAGPPTLPLAVTQFHEVAPAQPSPVNQPTFTVVKAGGSPYVASSQARAFLFKQNETRLVDLGTPRRDQVKTWQATPDDLLCVYDLAQPRPATNNRAAAPPPTSNPPLGDFKLFLPVIAHTDGKALATNFVTVSGCTRVAEGSSELTVQQVDVWQPDVIIQPQSAFTLALEVRNLPAGLSLFARHYPADDPTGAGTSAPIPLTYDATRQLYTGLLAAKRFALEAYLHIYQAGAPAQGVVVDYTLGGAPTLVLSEGDTLALSEGSTLALSDGNSLQVKPADIGQGALLVVQRDGLTLVLSEGSTLTLSEGQTLTLSDGRTLTLSQGTTLTLSDGNTLNLSDGSTLTLSEGATLALSEGSTLTLSDGRTLTLSDGNTLTLSDGSTLTLSDGNALVLNTGDAPLRSSDARMTLFVNNGLNFGWGEYYTVQQAAVLPDVPTYATTLGLGYRVTASPHLKQLLTGSVTMHYFGRDIASSKESVLLIYHWDEATGWQPLPTTVDEVHNSATAPAQGMGIYALLYSERIPLVGPAWNNFAYPVRTAALLPDAVASIAGRYAMLWAYLPNPTDGVHWQAFDPTLAPTNPFYDRVNTLKTLEFGKAYWIYMRENGTLYLGGSPTVAAAAAEGSANSPASINHTAIPPAIIYGSIKASANGTLSAGMAVTAWSNDKPCGQTVVQDIGGQLGYVLAVAASTGSGAPGCGVNGAVITFKLNGQAVSGSAPWDNTHAQWVALTLEN